jgi:flavin-dependent dehydrogenase
MSAGSSHVDVAVIGAGPAGIAVAVGLARLGHSVAVISARPSAALEGGSPRVLEALQSAGLTHTRASIRVCADRIGDWGGRREYRGHEYLIGRTAFDAALHRDAQAAGVRLLHGRVERCGALAEGWWVTAGEVTLQARALVDARGRRCRGPAVRGPRLLAVVRLRHRGG